MKTIKFIGMALFAILMCVNFTSCSKDDGPTKNDNGIITKGKRLTKLTCDDSDEFESYIFNYDDNGKLIEVIETKEGAPYCYYSFIWNDDFVQEIANYIDGYYSYDMTYFVKEGIIKNSLGNSSGPYSNTTYGDTLVYNSSNKLIRNKWHDGTNSFIWNDDKLISYSIKHYSSIGAGFDQDQKYIYSDLTCSKGCFHPILFTAREYLFADRNYVFAFAHPELFGLKTTQLPAEEYYRSGDEICCYFEYKIDNNGYVSNIIIKYPEWKDVIYTLTWE